MLIPPLFRWQFFKNKGKKALECSVFCGSFENAPLEADETIKRKKMQSFMLRAMVYRSMVCVHLCDNILFSSVAHVSHKYAVPFPQQLKEERTRVLFFLKHWRCSALLKKTIQRGLADVMHEQ